MALATPPPTNAFSFAWGFSNIFSLTNQSSFGYTHYTFTETASTASTTLFFNFSMPSVEGAWLLDDVSVTPAGVPDGGSTVSLLGCALLGLAALRRKLGC